ncbi:redoxin domain-containing protein [Mucilaginibacter angelicae]|uniref:Redoxin domain-containing protein n=1 Tax=Mucilaginibacter angelicae TaxID=869718 RepID=A0ABV6L7K1_9SPHI
MKYIFLLIIFTIWGFSIRAQDTTKRIVKRYNFNFDERTVVKDSTGKRYAYNEWQAMARKGYSLLPEDIENPNTAFILEKKGTKHIRYIKSESNPNNTRSVQKALSPEEAREQYIASLPKPVESAYFTTGEAIEPFSTHDINGNKIKLKDLRGKVVVLNFWFIGCPACMQEIPELNKLVDDYKDNTNVVFLAVALDGRYDLKKFLKQTEFKYDIIDDGGYIAGGYKIGLYPTSVILDKEGTVAFHTVGFALNSPLWMRKTINESLK